MPKEQSRPARSPPPMTKMNGVCQSSLQWFGHICVRPVTDIAVFPKPTRSRAQRHPFRVLSNQYEQGRHDHVSDFVVRMTGFNSFAFLSSLLGQKLLQGRLEQGASAVSKYARRMRPPLQIDGGEGILQGKDVVLCMFL